MTACTSFLAFFAEQTLAFAVKMHSRPDRWPQIVRFASGRADSLANRRFVNDLTWYPLDTGFPLHCSGNSSRRQLFHQLLTICPISRKPLSAPKSFPSVTVQGFPAGNYTTKKCVLFKAAKQCYSNIAGRKQNKPKRPSQRRISQCTKTRFTP